MVCRHTVTEVRGQGGFEVRGEVGTVFSCRDVTREIQKFKFFLRGLQSQGPFSLMAASQPRAIYPVLVQSDREGIAAEARGLIP